MKDVQKVPALEQGRPETGPMQFGEDWPGVFIRGDNALHFAMIVEAAAGLYGSERAIEHHVLKGLASTLRSCSVGETGWPPRIHGQGMRADG